MAGAANGTLEGFCHACFGGPYPAGGEGPGMRQRGLFDKERR
jgi:hypothetical protein